MEEIKCNLIVYYNNGYVRAYNRLPKNIHELIDVGIVKFVIDAKDMTYLKDGQWESLGTTEI